MGLNSEQEVGNVIQCHVWAQYCYLGRQSPFGANSHLCLTIIPLDKLQWKWEKIANQVRTPVEKKGEGKNLLPYWWCFPFFFSFVLNLITYKFAYEYWYCIIIYAVLFYHCFVLLLLSPIEVVLTTINFFFWLKHQQQTNLKI